MGRRWKRRKAGKQENRKTQQDLAKSLFRESKGLRENNCR